MSVETKERKSGRKAKLDSIELTPGERSHAISLARATFQFFMDVSNQSASALPA